MSDWSRCGVCNGSIFSISHNAGVMLGEKFCSFTDGRSSRYISGLKWKCIASDSQQGRNKCDT